MGYNKHQTFYLRINWVSKAIRYYQLKGNTFFANEDNFKDFGIGKNMFVSLRFWLEATNVLAFAKQNKVYSLTPIGEYIINADPKTSKNFTKLLLHYYLVTSDKLNNSDLNHVFYWFYNVYEDIVTNKEMLLSSLKEWSKPNNISDNSLRSDIDCLINLYSKVEQESPEDLRVSLLGGLGLVRITGNSIYKMPLDEDFYDYDAFYYFLLRWKEMNRILDVDALVSSNDSIGKVFNLNRTEILLVLDQMVDHGYSITIDKTNELNTINIKSEIKSFEFLQEIREKA